ncbi:MAG: hypothetical protein CYG61_05495 [Actinobacteria bacterium]|nr:MAG: hypothetical protein CYG61_05495 [Actinomycetota bacterium]
MDLALGGELVERAMARCRDGDALEAIIADTVLHGAAGAPSPVWDAVASVDSAPDVVGLGRWVTEKIAERPPPPHLSAIWFGLYELETKGGATHAAIQLSGGPGFPEDPQWLFKQDWYTPGYAPTPGLASLLALAAPAGPDLYWLVSYAVVFAYTLGLVGTTLDRLDPQALLGQRSQVGVAAGFHDGDIALVGVLEPSGLDRSELDWAG